MRKFWFVLGCTALLTTAGVSPAVQAAPAQRDALAGQVRSTGGVTIADVEREYSPQALEKYATTSRTAVVESAAATGCHSDVAPATSPQDYSRLQQELLQREITQLEEWTGEPLPAEITRRVARTAVIDLQAQAAGVEAACPASQATGQLGLLSQATDDIAQRYGLN